LIANDNTNFVEIDRMMRLAGMTHRDVEIVVLPGPDMIAALANGTIDAAFVAEPIPTRAVAAGAAGRWKGSNEIYPDQQAAVVMYSPTFVKERPEAAKRFMVAYVQGLRDYYDAFFKNANRAEIVGILTRYTSLTDPRLYDEMVPFAVDPDGGINLQTFTDDMELLYQEGLVPEKPDLATHVNMSYVDYAVSKLGRYQR
jgi:ABC-type nitrate/sulfonate/bicarbonate transport system substrate-binding protein